LNIKWDTSAVQSKSDCSIVEIGWSGFCVFNTSEVKLTPSLLFLTLCQEQPVESPLGLLGGDLLGSFVEYSSSWVDSTPQELVSPIPPPVLLFSMYFHLILNLFAPWMDLKFLRCIISINVLEQPTVISLSFLG
jgi:hypothetical protein